jgi:8-oxo-dGTP diphosphatase
MLFVNRRRQVLLLLRDDTSAIPYPNHWDFPGGHVEPGEKPEACIAREMKEEMGFTLEGHRLFRITEFADRREYTFWLRADFAAEAVDLKEGQRVRWFSAVEVGATELAYDFNAVAEAFFAALPSLWTRTTTVFRPFPGTGDGEAAS